MLGIFSKTYVIRKLGEQKIIQGHVSHPYVDSKITIDIQPLSPDEIAALPEGQRKTRRLKGFSNTILSIADSEKGTVGDRIFYDGKWFECVSSMKWDHSILSHCESQFVMCSDNESDETLKPPKEVDNDTTGS